MKKKTFYMQITATKEDENTKETDNEEKIEIGEMIVNVNKEYTL